MTTPLIVCVAGVDDMKMCEMTLAQTGLTSKADAEILAEQFEQDWMNYGGMNYLLAHRNQVSSKYLQQRLRGGAPGGGGGFGGANLF